MAEFEKIVPEVDEIVVRPTRYTQKVKAVDIDGIEYTQRVRTVTREDLVRRRDALQAQVDELTADIAKIDALEKDVVKEI